MAVLLLEELLDAERRWRGITRFVQPMFSDLEVEKADPDPRNKRHWYFATDNDRIKAHVYRPDYVLKAFTDHVVPMFRHAYGIDANGIVSKELYAKLLLKDTFTYLLFHELFHPVFCPKSKDDEQKFDLALKEGIKSDEPRLSPREIVNKAGNARNSMWDLLIDTFFSHLYRGGNEYGLQLEKALRLEDTKIGAI